MDHARGRSRGVVQGSRWEHAVYDRAETKALHIRASLNLKLSCHKFASSGVIRLIMDAHSEAVEDLQIEKQLHTPTEAREYVRKAFPL